MKRCPACGATFPDAFAFCTADATALVAAPPPAPEAADASVKEGMEAEADMPAPPPGSRKLAAAGAVVALAVVATAVAVAAVARGGARESARATGAPSTAAAATPAGAAAESFPGERHPETRTRPLSDAEVAAWDCDAVRYAINELYARRGYPFKPGKGLHEQFSRFSWYRPEPGLTDADADLRLSDTERANVKLLAARRDALACGGGGNAGAGASSGAVPGGEGVPVAPGAVSGWRRVDVGDAGFVLEVPAGWKPDPRLELKEGLRRWRFVHPEEPWVTLTVDVDERRRGVAPMAVWADLDARFARAFKERYAKLDLRASTLGGREAALWEFRIQRKGEPTLRKIDVTANYAGGGTGVAIVLAAPPEAFDKWRPVFDGAVARFQWAEDD